MILVIVGMHFDGFERLIVKMDDIAGRIDEKVIMQIGHTKYTPKFAEYFRFKESDEEIKGLMRVARVVICQGAMTIIDALAAGAPVIAVPRLYRYGEHLNDHQLVFAKKLEERCLLKCVEDVGEIEALISRPRGLEYGVRMNPELGAALVNFINGAV